MLGLDVASPVIGPTGRASGIDEAISQQRAINQAQRLQQADEVGDLLRYTRQEELVPAHVRKEYVEAPGTVIPGDGIFTFDEYIPGDLQQVSVAVPEQVVMRRQERPEMFEAMGLPNEAERLAELQRRADIAENNSYARREFRKAGMDVKPEDLKGMSDKDRKVIAEAQEVVDKHLRNLGLAGLGATGVALVGSGLATDNDSRDNVQDATVTAGLLGLGGYSGYGVGQKSFVSPTEKVVARQIDKGKEPKLYARQIGRDEIARGRRGAAGAAIGGGAGLLLGLTQALKNDEPEFYPFP